MAIPRRQRWPRACSPWAPWACCAGPAAIVLAAADGTGVPDQDPPSELPAVVLRPAVAGKHPRLLLSAARLESLRAYYLSPPAKLYHDQITRLLPLCVVPADRMTSHAWGMEAGVQRMPTVALHYLLTGDKASFAHCQEYLHWLDGLGDWTTDGEGAKDEVNSDTAASFTMFGAALMWDWLYNDLEPAFREKFRRDLWFHARALYYLGHLGGNRGGDYWRGVPAYNHRWFRDSGLVLATLAAAEGKPAEQWLLGKVAAELQFMVAWLPDDGSNHEGPNYGSAIGMLGMACQASDECLGTHHLDAAHFRAVAQYGLALAAPGAPGLCFGDCWYSSRSGGTSTFFLKTAAYHHQADVIDGIRQVLKSSPDDENGWSSLLFDDPALADGQFARLPATAYARDLGITVMRDSWQDKAVTALFKCGPLGGAKIQGWREQQAKGGGGLPYVNVAHEHPDQNSFILLADGQYVAETDRYSRSQARCRRAATPSWSTASARCPRAAMKATCGSSPRPRTCRRSGASSPESRPAMWWSRRGRHPARTSPIPRRRRRRSAPRWIAIGGLSFGSRAAIC